MEVHTHSHTPRKKWTHYFWEFLMLFLAVFCGFTAENFREKLIIREKAHHYLKNMVADLKTDSARLNVDLYYQQLWYSHLDSALNIPIERIQDLNSQDTFFYHFYPFYSWIVNFQQSDNTITQLKAGGFNLIHDEETIDSINAVYDFYKDDVKFSNDFYIAAYWDAAHKGQEIMILPPPAATIEEVVSNTILTNTEVFTQNNKQALQQLYNMLGNSKATLATCIIIQQQYQEKVKGLLAFLQKKYDID